MNEIRPILEQHLTAIFANDIDAYHASTVPELSLYEWHVTPHRIDGWPFHDFMMSEAMRDDTAGLALDPLPSDGSPIVSKFMMLRQFAHIHCLYRGVRRVAYAFSVTMNHAFS
jgi:hypothetical protein